MNKKNGLFVQLASMKSSFMSLYFKSNLHKMAEKLFGLKTLPPDVKFTISIIKKMSFAQVP